MLRDNQGWCPRELVETSERQERTERRKKRSRADTRNEKKKESVAQGVEMKEKQIHTGEGLLVISQDHRGSPLPLQTLPVHTYTTYRERECICVEREIRYIDIYRKREEEVKFVSLIEETDLQYPSIAPQAFL